MRSRLYRHVGFRRLWAGQTIGGVLASQVGLRSALIVGGSISLVAFTSLLLRNPHTGHGCTRMPYLPEMEASRCGLNDR